MRVLDNVRQALERRSVELFVRERKRVRTTHAIIHVRSGRRRRCRAEEIFWMTYLNYSYTSTQASIVRTAMFYLIGCFLFLLRTARRSDFAVARAAYLSLRMATVAHFRLTHLSLNCR